MKEIFLSWGMLAVSVVCNALGVFIIKLRLNQLGPFPTDSLKVALGYSFLFIQSLVVIVGVAIFFLAPFIFAVALSRMEMTIAYPAQLGLNFLIVLLLAVLFLGEQLTAVKLLGIAAIFVGIVLLYRGNA